MEPLKLNGQCLQLASPCSVSFFCCIFESIQDKPPNRSFHPTYITVTLFQFGSHMHTLWHQHVSSKSISSTPSVWDSRIKRCMKGKLFNCRVKIINYLIFASKHQFAKACLPILKLWFGLWGDHKRPLLSITSHHHRVVQTKACIN